MRIIKRVLAGVILVLTFLAGMGAVVIDIRNGGAATLVVSVILMALGLIRAVVWAIEVLFIDIDKDIFR